MADEAEYQVAPDASWRVKLKKDGPKKWHCSCGQQNMSRHLRCPMCSSQKPAGGSGKAAVASKDKKEFKWKVEEKEQYKFDFNSTPHTCFTKVDWPKALGILKSSTGAQGVYFVATDKGALVVKGSMVIAAEVFGARLGAALGIWTQEARIVCLKPSGYDPAKAKQTAQDPLMAKDPSTMSKAEKKQWLKLKRAAARATPVVETADGPTGYSEGEVMYDALAKLDSRGLFRTDLLVSYCSVSPFVSGVSLEDCGYDFMQRILGSPGMPSDKGKTHLQNLGAALAFDVLCHNSDRMPLVVDNKGNAGNVMFSTLKDGSYGRVTSIDNVVTCVDPVKHAKVLGPYVTACAALLRHLHQSPDTPAPCLQRVRDVIIEHTSFDIDYNAPEESSGGWRERMAAMDASIAGEKKVQKVDRPGGLEVQKGMLAFFQRVRDTCTVEMIESIKADIAKDREDIVGLEVIRSDYFAIMLALINDHGDLQGASAEEYIASHI